MEPLPPVPGPAPGPAPSSTTATAVRSASTPSASSSAPPRRILSCVCHSGPLPLSFFCYSLAQSGCALPEKGNTDSGSCRRDASTARSAVRGLSLVRLVYRSVLALSILTFPFHAPHPRLWCWDTHTPVLCYQSNPAMILIQAGAQCVQATRAPNRPRQSHQHELKRHLDRCEQLLQEVAGSRRGAPERPPSSSSSVSPVPEPITPGAQHSSNVKDVEDVLTGWTPFRRPDGKLVEHADGTVSFMEDGYLQSVHEEVSQAALCFHRRRPCEPSIWRRKGYNSQVLTLLTLGTRNARNSRQ